MEEPVGEEPVLLHLTKKSKNVSASSTGAAASLVSRRQFHGLTQICHTIRQEFQPLYTLANQVCVHACESADYAEMMLDLEAHHLVNGPIVANLCIDVASELGYDWAREKAYKGDVLDILKICCAHSSVLAQFTISLRENMEMPAERVAKIRVSLDRLFPIALSTWREIVLHDLKNIRLITRLSSPAHSVELNIDFNPGVLQSSVEITGGGESLENLSTAHIKIKSLTRSIEDIWLLWLSVHLVGYTGDEERISICTLTSPFTQVDPWDWGVSTYTRSEVEGFEEDVEWVTDYDAGSTNSDSDSDN